LFSYDNQNILALADFILKYIILYIRMYKKLIEFFNKILVPLIRNVLLVNKVPILDTISAINHYE